MATPYVEEEYLFGVRFVGWFQRSGDLSTKFALEYMFDEEDDTEILSIVLREDNGSIITFHQAPLNWDLSWLKK